MKKRFSMARIAFAPRQTSSGTGVSEIIRKMGVTEQTFYRWKKQYGTLGVPEIRQLHKLEEENRRLKRLAPALTLDKQMQKDVLSNKL